ncbi:MAG: DUF899 family protein [Caldilineaceae bacterium]|nr:DUF899 family protein [Caldilineaceae bacterium]MCY4117325.1 DUF899 family protein [Caldilineaceae bacterium]
MTHPDAEFDKELEAAYKELDRAQKRLAELRRQLPHEPVSDYELQGPDGPVNLSALFGEKEDLILVHNMGSGCSYCTLWADNFNGVAQHLQDRAAFVLVSPDSPAEQQEFARGRGWRFPLYSAADSTFTADMGFYSTGGYMSGYQPGVSVFRKSEDGSITRVAKDHFGPGDSYCGIWHLFSLLPDGHDGWNPQFDYTE